MKYSLLFVMSLVAAITSTMALAANERTLVAECRMIGGGNLEISLSDNGDEGLLHFAWATQADEVTGEFADNVQDDGAAFLKPGAKKLYVALEGYKAPGSDAAAVYLENVGGKIKGKLRSGFFAADLDCQKIK